MDIRRSPSLPVAGKTGSNVSFAIKHHSECASPQLPANWIGVRADWRLYSEEPWEHLVSVSPAELRTHALLIGSTGSGKTNLLHQLIAQDIVRRHAIAGHDLRGDFLGTGVELCAGRVDPSLVKILNLREKNRAFGFNPLTGSGEPDIRALHTLDVIMETTDATGVQLLETMRNGLQLVAETGQPLTELENLFYDRSFRYRCLERSASKSVRNFWQQFDCLTPDRQRAMAPPVLNKISLLLSTPTLRRILGHPKPIDLTRHLNTPGNVTLVSLAVDEHHAAGRMMGSLILSAICREVFARVEIPESQRVPLRLYVDEFQNFTSQDFETILAEGRRYKFSLVLANQSLVQLPPKLRSIILNNVGMKVIFRCGREDSATMSRDLFGDHRAYDFTQLPVGYCVLWRRDIGAVEVEVNEPLIRDVGAQSADAKKFLEEVYRHAGSGVEESTVVDISPSRATVPQHRPTRPHKISSSLEDWL